MFFKNAYFVHDRCYVVLCMYVCTFALGRQSDIKSYIIIIKGFFQKANLATYYSYYFTQATELFM